MLKILIFITLFVAWAWLFFLLYIGAMGILRAHAEKKMNRWLYLLCMPFMLVAFLYDVLSNATVMTIIYIELPSHWTFTSRLKSHIGAIGWRGNLSRFICQKILSPFDPSGDHCD